MTLKEQMIADSAIFMNEDELAVSLEFGGATYTALLESAPVKPSGGSPYTGLFARPLLLSIPVANMANPPDIGAITTLNSKSVQVTDRVDDDGMWLFTLVYTFNHYPIVCTITNPGEPNPEDNGETHTGGSTATANCWFIARREEIQLPDGRLVRSRGQMGFPSGTSIPDGATLEIGSTTYQVLTVAEAVDAYGLKVIAVTVG
jgi:hypothetical protein